MRRVIFSWINVLSEKLKRRDCVSIGLEPEIRFANKFDSLITADVNAHEERSWRRSDQIAIHEIQLIVVYNF